MWNADFNLERTPPVVVDTVTARMSLRCPKRVSRRISPVTATTVGIPGTDECVSIERLGICPSTAAHNSAQLMEAETDATRLER
jgi:hypothetical protein